MKTFLQVLIGSLCTGAIFASGAFFDTALSRYSFLDRLWDFSFVTLICAVILFIPSLIVTLIAKEIFTNLKTSDLKPRTKAIVKVLVILLGALVILYCFFDFTDDLILG